MLLCLVVCLALLGSFFLPSHLSFKHVLLATSLSLVLRLLPPRAIIPRTTFDPPSAFLSGRSKVIHVWNYCMQRTDPENKVTSLSLSFFLMHPKFTHTCTYTPTHAPIHAHTHIHVLMRDERRKEERSKQGQSKVKQTRQRNNTPKAVTFPK